MDREIAADDFQIGDFVHTSPSTRVEIRCMQRHDDGRLIVNPGDPDQLDGYVWQRTIVSRY
jgi:hypothetical protein